MIILDRLNALRAYMKSEAVDLCMIPTSDFHDSEYVSAYFKTREYFSGFTGSAGTLLVGHNEAVLFTDSRYFIQAQLELKDTGIKLMKMGVDNTPALDKYIVDTLKEGQTLGFDGRLIGASLGVKISEALDKKGAFVNCGFDASSIWSDRPSRIHNEISILSQKYAGESTMDKLNRIKEIMNKEDADTHIITSLDDIAWIMNLRGSDIECNPVFLSYMIIHNSDVVLYANVNGTSADDVKEYISSCKVILKPYEDFYKEGLFSVNNWTKKGILLDSSRISFSVYEAVRKNKLVKKPNPAYEFKAIKNKTEIENIRIANIKDGVALIKFNRYLSEAIANNEAITEMSLSEKLYEYRNQQDNMMGPSFETICAYGPHGAIVHYESSKETDVPVEKGNLLLIDSGAQYLEGTTDITRTYAIGEVSDEYKSYYTMVLKAHLRLMNAQFLKGVRGSNLDMIVKSVFWEQGLDFGHGTGHGIGCYLNVHELPVRISWPIREGAPLSVIFEPGMLVSDEPGFYLEGQCGIRIENDILCENRFTNEYGTFLGFEVMTLCPYDISCIKLDELESKDIEYLNNYHQLVFDRLSPYLSGDDLEYLKKSTEKIRM